MLTSTRSTTPAVEIRHAITRREAHEIARWRRVAGNPLPRLARHHLLDIHLHPRTDLPAVIAPRAHYESLCHLTIGDRS